MTAWQVRCTHHQNLRHGHGGVSLGSVPSKEYFLPDVLKREGTTIGGQGVCGRGRVRPEDGIKNIRMEDAYAKQLDQAKRPQLLYKQKTYGCTEGVQKQRALAITTPPDTAARRKTSGPGEGCFAKHIISLKINLAKYRGVVRKKNALWKTLWRRGKPPCMIMRRYAKRVQIVFFICCLIFIGL